VSVVWREEEEMSLKDKYPKTEFGGPSTNGPGDVNSVKNFNHPLMGMTKVEKLTKGQLSKEGFDEKVTGD
jgi:hypothetical protein